MSGAVLVVGNGRDEIHERSWKSLEEFVQFPTSPPKVIVDDREGRLGPAGAVSLGWRKVLALDVQYCFFLPAVYRFLRPVSVERMAAGLDSRERRLVQLTLSDDLDDEGEPNGFLGDRWLEHDRTFSLEPALIPTWVMRSGWPADDESGEEFGRTLFASDPTLRAGRWGAGERWTERIG